MNVMSCFFAFKIKEVSWCWVLWGNIFKLSFKVHVSQEYAGIVCAEYIYFNFKLNSIQFNFNLIFLLLLNQPHLQEI
jgi:hypothetical protein